MQTCGKDSEGEDLELGQRIASKLSVGTGSPPKEPVAWSNSSVFVDRRAPKPPLLMACIFLQWIETNTYKSINLEEVYTGHMNINGSCM